MIDAQECALILQAQSGDEAAKRVLCERFAPLIRTVSGRFFLTSGGASREELIQAGYIGLLCALGRYDCEKEASLGTYALGWIVGEMKRAVKTAVDACGAYDKRREIARAEGKLCAELGRQPTLDELAKACRMERTLLGEVLSLSTPLSGCGDEEASRLIELLPDEREGDDGRLEIQLALERLGDEERRLILLRYFRDQTQTETARLLGKSQAQISRIERRALDQLRMLLA